MEDTKQAVEYSEISTIKLANEFTDRHDPNDNDNEVTTTSEPCPILQVYLDVFYIYVYVIGPITVFGLISNIVILFIFGRHKTKLNSIFLLRLLAVSDMAFLFICFIYFPIRHLSALVIQGDEIFRRWDVAVGPEIFYCTLSFYFAAQQNRNWLTVLISLDRFLNLVFPFWARRVLSKRVLIYIFIVNIVASLGCNLYRFWSVPLLPGINPCTGEDEIALKVQSWAEPIDLHLYTVLTVILPLCLLYFMNITLIVVLNRMFSRRGEMTRSSQKDLQAQRQATMSVLGVCICFSICETPACLDRLASLAGVQFSDDDPFFNYARKIGLLLVVVDSVGNFFSYICTNRQFRRDLVRLCCCGGARRRAGSALSASTSTASVAESNISTISTFTTETT